MSYILCLGFYVKIYKTPPLVRVFLNDNFIDEFVLSGVESSNSLGFSIWSNEFKESKHKHGFLNPIRYKFSLNKIKNYINNKIFLKFFEINGNYIDSIKKHKLKIQVLNDDNNFTNGFLTKNTCIVLSVAYIVPKSDLINHSTVIDQKVSVCDTIRSKQKTISEILNYHTNYSHTFDLLKYTTKNYTDPYIWYNEKKQIFKFVFNEWIGISGYTELFFDEKIYTVDNSKLAKDGNLSSSLLYSLGNKYTQYANQRNID